ncbi:MAG: tRNA adenylyltransferase [Phycisphaerae bacterium]|nr:tRNA adenylyltransferase [Phycisphaerae bacterium]
MADNRLRRHIAREAAKLMYERVESEYYTAKRKAASRLGVNFRYQPQHLPANREIRDEIQILAKLMEGDGRDERLRDMRVAALRLMRLLEPFEPRLIGSVMTGHVRKGSDIDLHVFSDSVSAITGFLDDAGLPYTIERKRIIKHNEERLFTHIHVRDEFETELTVYARNQVGYRFKSSITGKAIERISIGGLAELIKREHPGTDVSEEPATNIDRYMIWRMLLVPLEHIKQDPLWHPEGDALYHSLQAFELARDEVPYDQELVAAALLHDVGKAIDPIDHAAAAVEALDGTITERESFLIAHHMHALELEVGRIGHKLKRHLQSSEWFDDLMTLRDIDNRSRRCGIEVCTIDEALEAIRSMDD